MRPRRSTAAPPQKKRATPAGRAKPRHQPRAKARRGGIDIPFLMLVFSILTIGLIMLFSASYPYAYYRFQDSFRFISAQLQWAAVGVAVMLAIPFVIDYHILQRLAVPLFIVSIGLLAATLAFKPLNGARRWIIIGSQTFQPSELVKFTLVVLFAYLIARFYDKMKSFRLGTLPFVLVLGLIAGIMLMQPHLSGTILMLLIGVTMMVIGGTNLRYFVVGGAAAGGALVYMVLFTDVVAYAMTRINAWLNPFADLRGDGWQTVQSLYAIGSGGLFGLGLGGSRQKYMYMSEPQNDFIFSIVCEELGFVGAVIIILLFALLVWRGFRIALHAPDKFGAMLVIGLSLQVGYQVLLNIAVATNSIPNTGIGLPFFSAGGTALFMLLAQMGVILAVSRHATLEKE